MQIKLLSPITLLSVALSVSFGLAAGVGSFTFVYAKGGSYLKDDPVACKNCHIMTEQYDNWLRSSHRSVAVCNDCHTPEGFFPKYVHKARNGWHHSVAFTSGNFHEPILIGPVNRAVTEERCRTCHGTIVQAIDTHAEDRDDQLACIRCHRNVGHDTH